MKRAGIFYLLLIILVCGCLNTKTTEETAKSSLEVIVQDGETLKALSGAEIELNGEKKSIGQDGKVFFANLENKTYSVTVSAVGYELYKSEVTIINTLENKTFLLKNNQQIHSLKRDYSEFLLTKMPNKTVYSIGDKIDLTGLVVTYYFYGYRDYSYEVSGDSSKWEHYTVEGFDSSKANQKLTLTVCRWSSGVNWDKCYFDICVLGNNDKPMAPTIEPGSGLYYPHRKVTMSSIKGLTIYYTLDGTEPTKNSSVYTEPFYLYKPTTVKAKTYANSRPLSDTTTSKIDIYDKIWVLKLEQRGWPNSMEFKSWEKPDLTGLTIRCIYTDDSVVDKKDGKDLVCRVDAFGLIIFDQSNPAVTLRIPTRTTVATTPLINVTDIPGSSYKIVDMKSNEGLNIYYTIDGTEPKKTSSVYSQPLTIKSDTTIKAKVFPDYGNSPETASVDIKIVVDYEKMYLLSMEIKKNVNKTTYNIGEKLDLTGLLVRYNYSDGYSREKKDSENVVEGFASDKANSKLVLKIYDAKKPEDRTNTFGKDKSVSLNLVILGKMLPPEIKLTRENDFSKQYVVMTAQQGAKIYYTTDSSEPTTKSTLYTEQLSFKTQVFIKAKAFADGFTPTETTTITTHIVDTPKLPPSQVSAKPIKIKIPVLAGTRVVYSTDGGNPFSYGKWISSEEELYIDKTTTIKAYGTMIGWNTSQMAVATYTINGKLATPTIAPPEGEYPLGQKIAISCSSSADAAIYYTTDGSEPTEKSTKYSDAIIYDREMTLKAKAFLKNWDTSDTITVKYSMPKLMVPAITMAEGAYVLGQKIKITSSNSALSVIYYTTDGTEPTEKSIKYNGEITFEKEMVLKAKVFLTGWKSSDTASVRYTVSKLAAPVITPPGGQYAAQSLIKIVCSSSPLAVIYYTLDGTEPTQKSYRYIDGIALTKDSKLKAKAFLTGWQNSDTVTVDFKWMNKLKKPILGDNQDYYGASTNVKIPVVQGTKVRYTLDGSEPSRTTGTEITKNTNIDITMKSVILKAIAYQDGFMDSDIATVMFTYNPLMVQSIEVTTLPKKTTYVIGDSLMDLTGIVVTAKRSDKTTTIQAVTISDITGFDTATTGTKTITITLLNKKTTFNITVEPVKLSSILVTTMPKKTTYFTWDGELDLSGIVVTGTYNNGSTKAETITASNITGFNTMLNGMKTLTVTVGGKTTTFDIRVKAPDLYGIEISSLPYKTKYYVGDKNIDLFGAVVIGTYENNTTNSILISEENIIGFDTKTPGDKTITVKVGEKTSSFNINVEEIKIKSLMLDRKPFKTGYFIGEKIDLEGIKVLAQYNKGFSVNNLNLLRGQPTDLRSGVGMINNITSISGSITISSNVENNVMVDLSTGSITIPNRQGTITIPNQSGTITIPDQSSTNIQTMNISNIEEIPINEGDVTGFDTSTPGVKTLTIQKGDSVVYFDIVVNDVKRPIDLKIESYPKKLEYFIGDDKIDLTGLEISGTYRGTHKMLSGVIYIFNSTSYDPMGTFKETVTNAINEENISGFDTSTPGIKKILLKMGDKTDTFIINVKTPELGSISLKVPPLKVTYTLNNTNIDLSGMIITGTYTNGEILEEKVTAANISGFDTKTIGKKTITVTINGKKTTFNIIVGAAELDKIDITKTPTKTSYFVGDTNIDLSGLVVTGTYKDKTTSVLDIAKANISGFDTSSAGTKRITVSVSGKTATFDLTVNELIIKSINVTKLPKKTDYFVNEKAIDLSGMEVTGFYNNGATKLLDITNARIKGFDTATIGAKDITVVLDGKETLFRITVKGVEIRDYFYSGVPSKKIYFVGEEIDLKPLICEAQYTDNTYKVVSIPKEKILGFDSSTEGVKSVFIFTKDGKFITYQIKVFDPNKTADEIKIVEFPKKTEYFVGDKIDLTGIKIENIYRFDQNVVTKSAIEDSRISEITGFDSNTSGKKIVTFVKTKQTYEVNVKPLVLDNISIKAKPTKSVYYLGDTTIDLTGLIVSGKYNNGTTAELQVTLNNIKGFDTKTTGTKMITVLVGDKSTTFEITVGLASLEKISITTPPKKSEYIIGDSLIDLSGLVVKGTYKGGATTIQTVTTSNISGFDTTTIGVKTITVSIGDKTAIFTITVKAPVVLSSIAVTTLPKKIIYFVGDSSIDLSGLVVTGTNSDGTTKVQSVTKSNISGFDTKTTGEKTITVKIGEKTTTFIINVNNVTLQGMTLIKAPSKTVYSVGDKNLDLTGIEIQYTYTDGTTKKEDGASVTGISGFNTAKAGVYMVFLSRERFSVSLSISVNNLILNSIEVATPPAKKSYNVGDLTIELAGLIVTGTYNNGTKQIITNFITSGFDTSKAGTKTITIMSANKTTTFDIIVNELRLMNIFLNTLPAKTKYYVGDTIDLTGIEVLGMYSNGTTKKEDISSLKVSGFDSSKEGNYRVYIFDGDYSVSYLITVSPLILNSITVTTPPIKTLYYIGDSNLDINGLVVTGSYNSGRSAVQTVALSNVSGFDTTTAGTKTITVTIGGKTATFSITVNEIVLSSIAITKLPTKTSYNVADSAIDLSGIVVTGTYNNGTQLIQDEKLLRITGFDTNTPGIKTITVNVGGKTATFTITVNALLLESIAIKTTPTKMSYNVGETIIDLTGLTVIGTYNNGVQLVEMASISNISGFDTTTGGTKTITVTIGGKTATFNITVNALLLDSIAIKTLPTKTNYNVGEQVIDLTGLVVMGTYSNGTQAVQNISTSNISGFNTATAGIKTITVIVGGKEAIFSITVSSTNVVPAGMILVEGNGTTIKDFYIGIYEVTQKEYNDIMGNNPSYFKGDTLPVERVNWYNAVEYCNTRSAKEGLVAAYTYTKSGTTLLNVTEVAGANGYRLPKEIEWEYAAKGGKLSNGYIYSGSNTAGDVAWYSSNSLNTTHPVGQKKPNELGLYDMSGSIWEWCWDIYNGTERELRGGSWSQPIDRSTVLGKGSIAPSTAPNDFGIRVFRTVVIQ